MYNKALVNYEYSIDEELNTSTAESEVVPTKITKEEIFDFTGLKFSSIKNVKVGDTVEYSILVTNTGNMDLKDINITDTIPEELTYIGPSALYINSASIDPIVLTDDNPEISLGFPANTTLKPNQTALFTFKVKVNDKAVQGQTISNTATIDANDSDGNPLPSDETTPSTVEVKSVQLSVVKEAPGEIHCGEPMDYVITITNESGEYSATNVVVTDFFNPEFKLLDDEPITVEVIKSNEAPVPKEGATATMGTSNNLTVTIPEILASEVIRITVPGEVLCCC